MDGGGALEELQPGGDDWFHSADGSWGNGCGNLSELGKPVFEYGAVAECMSKHALLRAHTAGLRSVLESLVQYTPVLFAGYHE